MHSDDDRETAPLDRINYIDGQRLTAELLRTEQDFHRRVRQWLSKSLFTPGVADGLEVSDPNEAGEVTVSPGLAIDEHGHAIVLVKAREHLKVEKRFLTIRYGEQTFRQSSDGCLVGPIEPGGTAVSTAWSGPTVIRKVPILEFYNLVSPDEDKTKIVLAEFEFDEDCKPIGMLSGPGRYASPRQVAGIHTFALEGEKDIDVANPKILRFHVHGRRPTSVSLYLQSGKFSSLYYTELGRHGHAPGSGAGTGDTVQLTWNVKEEKDRFPRHTHTIEHTHEAPIASARTTADGAGFNAWYLALTGRLNVDAAHSLHDTPAGGQTVDFSITTPRVARDAGNQLRRSGENNNVFPDLGHTHAVNVNVDFAEAGNIDVRAREANAISYLKALRIKINGKDVTDDVVKQLNNESNDTWTSLGDGAANHLLEAKGTGRLRLELLPGIDFLPGPYSIELFIDPAYAILTDPPEQVGGPLIERPNGGKIYYNLYVEAE